MLTELQLFVLFQKIVSSSKWSSSDCPYLRCWCCCCCCCCCWWWWCKWV